MAWSTPTTVNDVFYAKEEAITLPSSAGIDYSSVIDFLTFVLVANHDGYIYLRATASDVSGTNIDLNLYGSYTATGTKYMLIHAVVADLSSGTLGTWKSVNLKTYPMPYYFIGHTVDTDEDANNISYYITAGAPSNF